MLKIAAPSSWSVNVIQLAGYRIEAFVAADHSVSNVTRFADKVNRTRPLRPRGFEDAAFQHLLQFFLGRCELFGEEASRLRIHQVPLSEDPVNDTGCFHGRETDGGYTKLLELR